MTMIGSLTKIDLQRIDQDVVTMGATSTVLNNGSSAIAVESNMPEVGERLIDDDVWVEVYARAGLPTRFGEFEIFVFRSSLDSKEHVALVRGDSLAGCERVPIRVHSECLTGDAFGSLRCDCRDQLELALRLLAEDERGMMLYMRQEGRGIGLGNKIRAYHLQQDRGLDTVEANEHLGFDDDLRNYRVAALMIRAFKVLSVQLVTNNPRKMDGLREYGINVANRLPVVTEHNVHNLGYLLTKARKSGHLLPFI